MTKEERGGQEFILTLSCPDKPGIVYAVSSFLVQHSGNIVDSQQYEDVRDLTESYKLPFHCIPVTPQTKPAAEATLLSLIDETKTELVVLARYMQILSPEVCKRVEGRMINIHHSFLPSFKGARPYHQAYAKGVKLVGATAHYVTPDLDEGPIIEQGLLRVDHSYSPQRLAEAGRDVEAQVLARAVAWHAEHRVLLNGNRTVILY